MDKAVPKKKRIPLWGSVFTFLAIIMLCFLGNWQLKRHGWKQEILSKIQAEYEVDASSISLTKDDIENYSGLKRGYFIGSYKHSSSLLLQPRTHDGVAGYDVLTPFYIKDFGAKAILVNRGWIPHERERVDPFLMNIPLGELKIEGMLRRPPRHNAFTPENDPSRNVWYRVDINQIALNRKIDLDHRVVFYAEKEPEAIRDFPVSSTNVSKLSNNHMQYAIFWFGMAFVLSVIYVIRFIKN